MPSYVYRQADTQLFQTLQTGEFGYVLNSRQMGKSSLLVHTLQRLELSGYRCATVDITSLGSHQVTASQWYRGIVADLWRSLGLFSQGHYKAWWQEKGEISPAQKLQSFFHEVLLEQFPEDDFVILIDEIDSILSLDFPLDDFFALIRYCYNQRAVNPHYRRLTFGIFGVATPSDLIRDRQRTPFNIGQAISLEGFQIHECEPLLVGLKDAIAQAPVILQEILDWTGGQPFLTHKLCALIWLMAREQGAPILVSAGQEAVWVKQLVHDRILHQWEAQDEPEHLRTIRDRLLRHPERTGRLLGLYQQILRQGQIPHEGTDEVTELQLAGLVKKAGNQLQVKNPIYQAVFDEQWIAHHLDYLRPYSQALTAWLASARQDPSRLLRGQALQDAQQWAAGKRLSDEDYQFLAASVECDRQEVQTILEAERSQAIATQLRQSRRNLRLQRWLSGAIGAGFLLSTGLGLLALWASHRANQSEQIARRSEIKALLASAQGWFASNHRLDALVQVIRAQQQLESLATPDPDLAQAVDDKLQKIILGINERNRFVGHEGEIRAVAYHPDGTQIASASLDGTVKLWATDGTLLQTLESDRSGVRAIAFSPSGDLLATAGAGQVRLWNVETGEEEAAIAAHEGLITSLTFSPDGQQLVTGSTDSTLKLWQRDGTQLQTLTGHGGMIRGLAFSPDGQVLASASADATIKLWQPETGQLLNTLTGHDSTVTDVAFSPDGRHLVSGSTDSTLKLWSRTGELISTFEGHRSPVTNVHFSPDGRQLVSTGDDSEVRFWQPDGEPILAYPGLFAAGAEVAFSPDGRYLVSTGRRDQQAVLLWQLDSPFYSVLGNHASAVIAIALNPAGDLLASAGSDAKIKLWQPDGTLLKTLAGHRGPVISLDFSSDGTRLASSSFDGTVRLWQSDGTPIFTSVEGNQGAGRVDFHPRTAAFVAAGEGLIHRWQSNGEPLSPFRFNSQFGRNVVWHPQGTQLAVGVNDSDIQLIDAVTGIPAAELVGHQDTIRELEFNSDGSVLASASSDRTVRLWDVDSRSTLQVLEGHTDVVWDVTFVPPAAQPALADLYVATGSADSTIKLWNQDGTVKTTLDRHTAKVLRLEFSPDGQYLFSASNDNTIIRWDLPALLSVDPRDYACQWLQDYLDTNAALSPEEQQLCDR